MRATVRDRWQIYNPYLTALAVYGSSRLVVVSAMYFASRFVVPNPVSATPFLATTSWYHYLLRWDSIWYATIVNEGYRYSGDDLVQQSVVFYPLYPLIAKAITIFTGINGLLALLIVANVAGVLGVLALFKYVRQDYGDEIAFSTIAFFSFFPASLFLSTGYTESLTLLMILCSFLMLKRERFFFSSAFAGLAVATRSTGLVLLPVIIWELWRKFGGNRRRFISYTFACSVLATSGLWLYMIYLWSAFGNPFAFATDLAAWENGGGGFVHKLTSAILLEGFFPLRLPLGPASSDVWFFLVFLILILTFRRWLPSSLYLFALGVLLLPYLTRTGGPLKFNSMTRYILLAFPVFIVMAKLCTNRLWLVPCVIGLFAGLLFMYSAFYAQWYWVG